MPIPSIPTSELGEFTVSVLIVCAGITKWISDRSASKVKNEPKEVTEAETNIKVITKDNFDDLMQQVEDLGCKADRAKNAFEDTLACITIINILLQILATDRRKTLLKAAEKEVYIFLRHTEFPSRVMITSMFEMAVKDADNDDTYSNGLNLTPVIIEETKKERDSVDT